MADWSVLIAKKPKTKTCTCGKQMIVRWRSEVICTYPAIYTWYWWCACGHEEEGGEVSGTTEEAESLRQWKAAQIVITLSKGK